MAPQQPAMWGFIDDQSEKSSGKGIFIAASRLSGSAKDAAEKVSQNIITIDGEDLVECMARYEVGVRIDQTINPFTK